MNHHLSLPKPFYRALKPGLRVLVLLLMLVPLFNGPMAAQAENDIEWIRREAGHHQVPAHDFAPKNAVGLDGSVYVFGTTDGVLEGQNPIGETDLYIRKFAPDGTQTWARQFGAAGEDSAMALAVDNSAIYIAGSSTGENRGFAYSEKRDSYVSKLDLSGNLLWTRSFGCPDDLDTATGIAVTAGSVYVVGDTNCAIEGASFSGNQDTYIRKYGLDGTFQWMTMLGTVDDSTQSAGIAADETGVYVAGHVGFTAFVKKFNESTGSELWSQPIAGSGSGNEQLAAISVSGSVVYVAGSTSRMITGEHNPAGWNDAFIITFGADGTPGWAHQFGTVYDDVVTALAVNSSGVYAGGYTNGAFPGFTEFGGRYDAFAKHYSLVGDEGWALQYGTAGNDDVYALAAGPDAVYLSGFTGGSLDGNATLSDSDLYLKKISSQDASQAWTQTFHAIANYPDHDNAYSVDARDGYVYLAGASMENRQEPTQSYPVHGFVTRYSPAGELDLAINLPDGTFVHSVAAGADGSIYVAVSKDIPLYGDSGTGYFLVKYDPQGNPVWLRHFIGNLPTGHYADRGDYIAVDDTGVYLAGEDGYSKFVMKFSLEGDLLWRDLFGSWPEEIMGIAVHSSGLYVSGYTWGALPGQTNAGYADAFMRKYALTGGVVWTRQFGTSTSDALGGIAVADSGIYVVGDTSGTMDGQASLGGEDIFVQKYDLDGTTLLWTRQFGTDQADSGTGIAVDQAGVYVIGNTELPVQSTFRDVPFIQAFNLDGTDGWSRSFDNQTELGMAFGVAVDAGAVYVSGDAWMWDYIYSDDATLIKLAEVEQEENEAPVVGAITAPVVPVAVNTAVNASASFGDANTSDTHTAAWDWGDGTISAGTITESSGEGTVSGTKAYTASGVYEIKVTVIDQGGLEGSSSYQYVVVYDPSAGFVTGAGWINSPAGAYAADPTLEGKATFGFVSRYQKGASQPTGNTTFHFALASLSFKSTSYDWLVVAGARIQFKGSGTIKGEGDYGFLLTAVDGEVNGGGGVDKFRIKIWDKASGAIVYDNQMGASDTADLTTAIGAGSIKIQK